MENIGYKTFNDSPPDARFSILIPTWNNLEYVRLCVESIQKNSKFPHQIILHINEGKDGTRKWAEENRLDHSYSPKNVGICHAINATSFMAKTDYIFYMNDDMYVCPEWDLHLLNEIENLGNSKFLLSSTLIEPKDTNNPVVLAESSFGDSLENFKESLLLEKFTQQPKTDWNGAGGCAIVVHRNLWNQVGGYSVEFSPGMYSDPDFSMKLWQAGVRIYKGISKSRIFHFQAKSTERVKKNDGRTQFRRKWQIPSSRFLKYYLRLGTPFSGPLEEPVETLALKFARLRGKFF
jgi:GT2 family glycosyltransferase